MKNINENLPSVWVTKNRNRLKRYDGNNYYLNNKDEFELEIFNPTKDNILAKILLNDKLISETGLIIRPGQRVYLERYLDDNKKFLFETYTVENSTAATEAIKNNGSIQILFYKESYITNFNRDIYYGNLLNTDYIYYTNPLYNNLGINDLGNNSYNITTTCFSNIETGEIKINNNIETGQISKGSNSNQKFTNSNMSFEYFHFHKEVYKILPFSVKSEDDLRLYCSNCGTRRKKSSWKFCPSCGNKI